MRPTWPRHWADGMPDKVEFDNQVVTFKCPECGDTRFYRGRPWNELPLENFYEGSYRCAHCEDVHDYMSDAFKIQDKQLELF